MKLPIRCVVDRMCARATPQLLTGVLYLTLAALIGPESRVYALCRPVHGPGVVPPYLVPTLGLRAVTAPGGALGVTCADTLSKSS